MNNFLKIFSRKKILFILLFFSYQLFALDDLQVQNEKPSADSLINKIAVPKDSTSGIKRAAGLVPLYIPSLLDENFKTSIITKKTIETTDYRTTADFFTNIPFGFVRDLGSVGQPNEVLIYGLGFGNVSFLSDGISINNRLSNALDLNLFQYECIDSIEVIPLSRGFLYGGMNNPVAVNFISRQPELRKPYSRLKYFQAPNSEGMIDGIFNISPFKRLNAYFEITNQSTSANFDNTDHSNWMGAVRLRYLLSNNINIIAGYKYVQTITQLFGGIDADSINRGYSPAQFDEILYDNFRAPVRFTNRYQKVTGHNFNLRMLGNFIEHSPTDISFYYQTNLTEFRQNEPFDPSLTQQSNAAEILDDNESKTYGFNFRQDLKLDFLKLTSLVNYERTKFSSPLLSLDITRNVYSVAGVGSLELFDKSFIPTGFVKYLRYSGNNYLGAGGYASLLIDNEFNLAGGLSSFEKPRSIIEEQFSLPGIISDKQKISLLEISATYKNKFLNATFSYTNQAISNALMPAAIKEDSLKTGRAIFYSAKYISLQGINLNGELRIWKILIAINASYYFDAQSRSDFKLPKFTSSSSFYYVDTLFKKNLHLKTGFNFYSIGSQDYTSIDFEKSIISNSIWDPATGNVSPISASQISPSFLLDFFLAGKIQNSATVYFVFENLLDTKYFIVPYYPKQARGIRFGVAWEFLD